MEQSTTALAAEEIRAQLARQKHSASWLAAEVGVSPATVSRWLSGDRTLTLTALGRIARALGVPAQSLLPEQVAA